MRVISSIVGGASKILRLVGHGAGVGFLMSPWRLMHKLGMPISVGFGATMTYGALPLEENLCSNKILERQISENSELRGQVTSSLNAVLDNSSGSYKELLNRFDKLQAVSVGSINNVKKVANSGHIISGILIFIAAGMLVVESLEEDNLTSSASKDVSYGSNIMVMCGMLLSTVVQLFDDGFTSRLFNNTENLRQLHTEIMSKNISADIVKRFSFLEDITNNVSKTLPKYLEQLQTLKKDIEKEFNEKRAQLNTRKAKLQEDLETERQDYLTRIEELKSNINIQVVKASFDTAQDDIKRREVDWSSYSEITNDKISQIETSLSLVDNEEDERNKSLDEQISVIIKVICDFEKKVFPFSDKLNKLSVAKEKKPIDTDFESSCHDVIHHAEIGNGKCEKEYEDDLVNFESDSSYSL